jgi:hypothetical protein
MAINMGRVWNYSTMEIDIKVTIRMVNHRAKGIIIGVMDRHIRDNLKMD